MNERRRLQEKIDAVSEQMDEVHFHLDNKNPQEAIAAADVASKHLTALIDLLNNPEEDVSADIEADSRNDHMREEGY
jgi:hypothetical protein